MAYARQCDRCKSYYDKNKGVRSINGCLVKGIRLETLGPLGPYKVLDLCDECIVDLYKFLGLNKEEEDDD